MISEAPSTIIIQEEKHWFVMRDLTRSNAKLPAYRMLEEKGLTYFTPMAWKIVIKRGKRERQLIPLMQDLLFVYDSRTTIDPIVARVRTFQYRFMRGTNREPMIVRKEEMERFIRAVSSSETTHYYRPEEVTPAMCSRRIRIVGGELDGCEGFLETIRGSKVKRLLIEIPRLLAATVEVKDEYIQLL